MAGFVQSNTPGVIIETLEPLRDGPGYELGAFESRGVACDVALSFAAPPKQVTRKDLFGTALEGDVAHHGKIMRLAVKSFEIITLRVKR